MTLLLHFLQHFITGLIIVCLGMPMVNVKLEWKKVLGTALFYAGTSLYIDSLPLFFGLGLLITILVTTSIVMVNWILNFFQALLAVLLGLTSAYLLDGALIPLATAFFQINAKEPTTTQLLWLTLPQALVASLIAYFFVHKKIFLIDFGRLRLVDHPISKKRDRLMFALYTFLLICLIFEMIYNLNDFGFQLQESINSVNLLILNWISNITVISAIVVVSILLKNLLDLSEKERDYIVQKSYSETLEELYTAISAQQHDLANHFQTLYGFMQLHFTEEATRYLESLMGSTPILRKISDTGSVPLSSLLYIKSGLAKEQDIAFNIKIKAAVTDLKIPSYEINRIVGNLINNAFEAVVNEDEKNRWVEVVIDQDESSYIFAVSNYGTLNEDMQKKMLIKGFSTKKQNGLGLFIVKTLADKYQGQLDLYSKENQVCITLRLPRQSQG